CRPRGSSRRPTPSRPRAAPSERRLARTPVSLEAPELRGRERRPVPVAFLLEEAQREDDAVGRELLEEVRLEAGAAERGQQAVRRADPGRVLLARRLRDEDVLQRD